MAAVLRGEGSFAFVGGGRTHPRLFRAAIKGGELRLLVVLTGAEHNEVGSVCEGTPWMVQTAQASKRPRGKRGGEEDKAPVLVPGRDTWTQHVIRSPALWRGRGAMRGNGAGANKPWQCGLCSPALFAELIDPISTAQKERLERASWSTLGLLGCVLELSLF